jgi:hypothetical protein
MRVFLVACLTAGVLALLCAAVLDKLQEPVDGVFATQSVRL